MKSNRKKESILITVFSSTCSKASGKVTFVSLGISNINMTPSNRILFKYTLVTQLNVIPSDVIVESKGNSSHEYLTINKYQS